MTIRWNLIRSFEAVAETGSLSAAARALGMTQPAVGRHVDLLEEQLRIRLFQRGPDGMRLTAKGADLVPVAREMMASAASFGRIAAGLEVEIGGTVRISANDVIGVEILPSLLAGFQQDHPDIDIELAISNTASNLTQRDADVAVRMFRPKQNDLIARKVAELPMGFFAHHDYLAAFGSPKTPADLSSHRLIGFDHDTLMLDEARAMGLSLAASDFTFRCDNILAQIAALRAGAGIAIAHCGMAAHWPGVEAVLEDFVLPPLELWVVCHSDVRFNPRIRTAMDFLCEKLRRPYAGYNPSA